MKKYLLIFSLVLLPLFTAPAQAVTIDPADYSPTPGTTMTFKLYSAPPANSAALQLRLGVVAGTITDYVLPTSGELLALGVCEGSLNFTASEVCVDFASQTGSLDADVYLGEVTVTFASEQSLLYKASDNAYVVGIAEFQTDFGALAGDETLLPVQVALTATPAPSPAGEAVGTDENPELDTNPVVKTPWLTYALYAVGALLLLGSIVTVVVLIRKNKSSATPGISMPVNSSPVPDSGLPPLPPLPDLPVATAAPNSDLSALSPDPIGANPVPSPESAPPAVVPQPEATNPNGLPPLPQI